MEFVQQNATTTCQMLNQQVSYIENGETFTGRLSLIVRSEVDPKFDLAYIEFEKHWKIAFLNELI